MDDNNINSSMTEEPTPIADALQAWGMRDPVKVYGELAIVSAVLFYIAGHLEIVWLGAATSVTATVFGAVAFGIYLWRRFKHWRYPSYYQNQGDGDE